MIFIYYYIIIAFLLGIIFVQWIIPLVDGLINLLLTQFEVWKGYMTVKISKSQQKISNMSKEPQENINTPIGFAILEEEEEQTDEEVL